MRLRLRLGLIVALFMANGALAQDGGFIVVYRMQPSHSNILRFPEAARDPVRPEHRLSQLQPKAPPGPDRMDEGLSRSDLIKSFGRPSCRLDQVAPFGREPCRVHFRRAERRGISANDECEYPARND